MIDRRIAEVISEVDPEGHGDVEADDGALSVLRHAIGDLAELGGKRLRPMFVVLGSVAAGGSMGASPTLDAAAAVEFLHTFALIHDDVMDRSAVRRGRPTAHRALRHLGTSTPDPDWFGVSAAVLAGDLAHVWADELFDASVEGVDPEHQRVARRLFAVMRREVIAGQYLDLRTGCHADANEEDASRVALLKSARYTVTRPLQVGAALAGGSPELSGALARYGDSAGMAFQLRDDVLGVFGDPGRTGKSRIDDLREGKRTLLVVRAMELTTDAGRALLAAALGRTDLDEADAQRCRDAIADSGALASVETAIETYLDRALAEAGRFAHGAAEPLRELAERAARRDH